MSYSSLFGSNAYQYTSCVVVAVGIILSFMQGCRQFGVLSKQYD